MIVLHGLKIKSVYYYMEYMLSLLMTVKRQPYKHANYICHHHL